MKIKELKKELKRLKDMMLVINLKPNYLYYNICL